MARVTLSKDEECATYACTTIPLATQATSAPAAHRDGALSARWLWRDGSANQPNQHADRANREYPARNL